MRVGQRVVTQIASGEDAAHLLLGLRTDGAEPAVVYACVAVVGGSDAAAVVGNAADHIAEVSKLLPSGMAVVAVAAAPSLLSHIEATLLDAGGVAASTGLATLPLLSVRQPGGAARTATPAAEVCDDAELQEALCIVRGALPPLAEVVPALDWNATNAHDFATKGPLRTATDALQARCRLAAVRPGAPGEPLSILVPSTAVSVEQRDRQRQSAADAPSLVVEAGGGPVVGIARNRAAAVAAAHADLARCIADAVDEWVYQLPHQGARAPPRRAPLPGRVEALLDTAAAGNPTLAAVPAWYGYGTPEHVVAQYTDLLHVPAHGVSFKHLPPTAGSPSSPAILAVMAVLGLMLGWYLSQFSAL
eukprot:TRINITY_DN18096_c0_g1_i1.p1 TRINITY_DN18096_c0_g1~~TRINITY_DN18096_c0_g1_i1.p1  ORF type:complete len:361 (+),score=52.66 TRINITY_DN18096_c0_g1_i1:100-1182(+)